VSVFAILARRRWGEQCIPLAQVRGSEERAIGIAQRIYKDAGMNRALVVDDRFRVVFKIERRCKCINCQWEISGKLMCVDCRREINVKPYIVEAYQ